MISLQSPSTQQLEPWKLPKFVSNPDPEIYLKSNNYVVLDFETTNVEKGDAGIDDNRLILAVWLDGLEFSRGNFAFRAKRAGEFDQRELAERLGSVDFIVCHNAKFELKWLHRMGVELRELLPYDTQIGEYVIAGNRKRALTLGATAGRYGLGAKKVFVHSLIKSGYPVEDIPEEDLYEYCKQDVELTHGIFLKQRETLRESGLLRVFYTRCITTPCLADIEYKGTRLDEERVRAVHQDYSKRYKDASEHFERLTGGINFRSSKQVREYLYDRLGFGELLDYRGNPLRTKAGQKVTSKDLVAKLEAKTKEQKEFKDALLAIMPLKRKMQILDSMMKCCEEDGGYIYASYNQTVTATGRLSSTGGKWGFQFHNFPREFKPLFRARKDGWVVVEGDSPQLEFRCAVDMGNDAAGKRDIQAGVDVHALSAATTRRDRQSAKAVTFRPLYGGNSGTPLERAYYKAFREKFSGIYETQNKWTYNVLRSKQLRIPSGLVFYWPDTRLEKNGYIKNRESIFNYPIQSFATADIIPLTLVLVWHYSKGRNIKITNTVHDSIIADVHPEEVTTYCQILRDAFTKDIYWLLQKIYSYTFTTNLGVGIKVGSHWGEGKEIKYEANVQ